MVDGWKPVVIPEEIYETVKLTKEFKGATRKINETEKMSAEQIESLVNLAESYRDRAVIWCMFQGGMDRSTVRNLDWGDVEKDILNPPMGAVMLRNLARKKEPDQTFCTLIYETAVKHLVRHLNEEYGEHWKEGKRRILVKKEVGDKEKYVEEFVDLEYDTPLFTGHRGHRLAGSTIAKMMRKIAPDSGIAGTRLAKATLNPLRPHSLRASFSDQMAKAGASKQLVDYLQGHKLSFDTAYFGGEEGLRETYVKYAQIALEPKRMKAAPELADSIARQDIVVSNLAAEVKKLREFKNSIENRLQQFEKAEQYIAQVKKQMKFYKEDGVVISYTDEISKKELGELIAELRERRKQKEG